MRKPAFVAIVRSGISGKETGKRLLPGLAAVWHFRLSRHCSATKHPFQQRLLPDDDVAS